MATKLSLYQGACAAIGVRKIMTLTEDRLSRRELDGVFARGGVRSCLRRGQWNFSIRTIRLDSSPSIEPDFGYQYAFDKPTDWVRTAGIAADENFLVPLTQYEDEAAHWYSDIDPIYVRYVSDDVEYGLDYSLWPEDFSRYAEAWFGLQVHDRLVNNAEKKELLKKDIKRLLVEAKSSDAMDEPSRFIPAGSWSTSRRSGDSRRDLGSRRNLIG
jgi:hypothetical protein